MMHRQTVDLDDLQVNPVISGSDKDCRPRWWNRMAVDKEVVTFSLDLMMDQVWEYQHEN